MKGQVITHTIVIGFAIILVLAVIVIMTSVNLNYREFVADREMEQVCTLIKSSIEDSFQNTTLPDNEIYAETYVDLPAKIADTPYRAGFSENYIIVELLDEPKSSKRCYTGFDASFLGSTNGGLTYIVFTASQPKNIIEMNKV